MSSLWCSSLPPLHCQNFRGNSHRIWKCKPEVIARSYSHSVLCRSWYSTNPLLFGHRWRLSVPGNSDSIFQNCGKCLYPFYYFSFLNSQSDFNSCVKWGDIERVRLFSSDNYMIIIMIWFIQINRYFRLFL